MKGNKKSLCDRCIYYEISRSQRYKEISDGLGTIGTQGYANQGCYDCDGYNIECDKYFSKLELYRVQKNDRKKI